MSQVTRLPRAVLDADIIFSRVLHELMGRTADDLRLFDLLWSEELLAEVRRSLVEKKGLSEEVLLTFDRAYLKDPLRLYGVEVPDLDEFLVRQCEEQPEAFRQMVEEQADIWGGGRPVGDLLAAFERASVPKFAAVLGPLVDQ